MSGRIWVIEQNEGTRAKPKWWPLGFEDTRADARRRAAADRKHSKHLNAGEQYRVVQYVRQGGAR